MFLERIAVRHKEVGTEPVYCLSERQEKGGCKILYELFISCSDEYDFAIKAFGSIAHLDKLKTIKWFMEGWGGCKTFRGYEAWLEDMRQRDASIAKSILLERAREGDVSAAKKIADMAKPLTSSKAGRPRKEDIKREAVKQAEEAADIEDDAQRLNVITLRR